MKSWFTSASKLLRSASKPGIDEFWLLFRVCLIGIAVLGVLGFIIRLIFALIGLAGVV
ncbi:MAG: protein translocase SEC61 complex subunit gamma [Candidatus Bathyarchaeia archaeon]